jgi:hypothetical protein
MRRLVNFCIAVAVSSLMLSLLAVSDHRVTATNVRPAQGDSAFAESVTVEVSAAFNSTDKPKRVNVSMVEGALITITAAANDTWTLGPGADRECNADGCPKFPNYGQFKYGVLKGRFLTTGGAYSRWFLVGTSYQVSSPYTGWLELACHDDVYNDNKAAISVTVDVKRVGR